MLLNQHFYNRESVTIMLTILFPVMLFFVHIQHEFNCWGIFFRHVWTHNHMTNISSTLWHHTIVPQKRRGQSDKIKREKLFIFTSLEHFYHQSYSQLPNFSGQEWKSMGKSSRCMGHSACTVNLQPNHSRRYKSHPQ